MQVKDFKIVYRPLYNCGAALGRFESHVLACSHFSRWESKFKRLQGSSNSEIESQLPQEVAELLLYGPFVHDPKWTFGDATMPTGAPPGATRSGLGTRSHEIPLLEHLIGDYCGFIDALVAALAAKGLDVLGNGYELDHICYRCASVAQYRSLCAALVPRFGTLAGEGTNTNQMIKMSAASSELNRLPMHLRLLLFRMWITMLDMIGGRPIATVRLHEPIVHHGFTVKCIEVPCPKAGRHYAAGLE